jgi:hypothetical protein
MPGYTLSQFSIFDKFRDFIPCVSIDGLTVGGDAGYVVTPRGVNIDLITNNVNGDEVYLYTSNMWRDLVATGRVVTIEFLVHYLEAITNQTIYLCVRSNILYPSGGEGKEHFGWKIIGADLYATNSNNSDETITDTGVDMELSHQRTRLKMVYDPGQNLKFYVNDVLKATHTTNLPQYTSTGRSYGPYFSIITGEDAVKEIDIGRILIEREN